MKWIDDKDDYFLRDFDDQNEAGQPASGDNTGGVADDAQSVAADHQRDEAQTGGASGNEFSFHAATDPAISGTGTSGEGSPKPRRRRVRRRLVWFLIIVFAVLGVAFYIRYFVPYASETLTTGYISLVEKRGIFFKTFEGEMISESMLADTARVYSRDFYFSIPNDSLGRLVQSYQGTGKRVTVTTQRYFGTLPWRGSQKSVVTGVTPAE